jgi:hypothetical protein
MPTKNKITVGQSLELMQWIIDPSSRPYDSPKPEDNRLIARSGSMTIENEQKKSTVQKLLELQQFIIEGSNR